MKASPVSLREVDTGIRNGEQGTKKSFVQYCVEGEVGE